MDRPLKVLVTGATGAVGPIVVNELHKAGHSIRTLSLDAVKDGIWSDYVEQIVGDVTDMSAVQSAMKGVDAVVHLAALLHIVNPQPELKKKYEHVNIGGTSNVVSAALNSSVKRVLLFSTIAVYGNSNGGVLTEKSVPNPDTFYSYTKQAAERIVLDALDCYGRHMGTVLRLGAVYGPRIKGNCHRLLMALEKKRFLPVGDGNNRRTLIYDKDVARAAVHVLEHPLAGGKIYNVSDGRLHTMDEIIEAICHALDRPIPVLSLPSKPMRLIAGLIEDSARIIGIKPPICRATIDKYIEDIAVDSSLIREELGFNPIYDLTAGWHETIESMKESGELN
jgi:nucleoside-diphosphate-sugar epimerase